MKEVQEVQSDVLSSLEVRDLLRESGDVLSHPLLLAIVLAAPTPRAADHHVHQLGFGNELSRQVRAAVYLRQRLTEKEWTLVQPTKTRIWETMLSFGPKGKSNSESEPVPNAFWHFGPVTINCSNWPLLLREFCLTHEGRIFTTVDGEGLISDVPWSVNEEPEMLFNYLHGNASGRNPSFSWLRSQCQMKETGLKMTTKNGHGFFVNTGLVVARATSLAEPFPKAYKIVEIRNCGSSFGEFGEFLRLKVRVDFRPSPQTSFVVGELNYICHVRFSEYLDEILTVPYDVSLSSSGQFFAVLNINRLLQGFLKVGLSLDSGPFGMRFECSKRGLMLPCAVQPYIFADTPTKAAVIHSYLLEMADRICRHERINLASVLGEELFLNQPDRIIDLLVSGIPPLPC